MDNPELGWLAYKNIIHDLRRFDMSDWAKETSCGTVACLAGHVLLAAGYTYQGSPDRFISPAGVTTPDSGNDWLDAGDEAAILLGLSDDEVYGEKEGYDDCLWGSDQPRFLALQRFKRLLEAS